MRNISLPPQENLEGRVLRRDEGTSFGVVADALGAGEPRLGGRVIASLLYKLRRKSIIAAPTSGARSCWVQ